MVKCLLDAGANYDVQGDFGRTALMWAIRHAHWKAAARLIDASANIDIQDKFGITALMSLPPFIRSQGRYQIVEQLIAAGADVNIRPGPAFYERAALHLAVSACDEKLVKILVLADADLDIQDDEGSTAEEMAQERLQRYQESEDEGMSDSSEGRRFSANYPSAKKQAITNIIQLLRDGPPPLLRMGGRAFRDPNETLADAGFSAESHFEFVRAPRGAAAAGDGDLMLFVANRGGHAVHVAADATIGGLAARAAALPGAAAPY